MSHYLAHKRPTGGISDRTQRALALAAVCVVLLLVTATWLRPCPGNEPGPQASAKQASVAAAAGAAAADIAGHKALDSKSATQAAAKAQQKVNASIVVMVPAKADSQRRRSWLREQFHRNVALLRKKDPAAADSVVFKFVVGRLGLSDADVNLTSTEQQRHGDLLLLDIIDINTPDPPPEGVETATVLKVIHSAKWAYERYHFPWFVRLGDDTFFRVDHFLLNVAPTLARKQLIFGYAEDPQLGWSWSNQASLKRYCSGMGFIMTPDVVKYIVDNEAVLYKGYPEDAVVGLWFAGTTIRTQHDTRLHDWEWKRCSEQTIMVHKHDYGKVDDDGVMRSCFPAPLPAAAAGGAAAGAGARSANRQ